MSDDRDDHTPPAGSKSSNGPKKRFQTRGDRDDEDDDRPRKKRPPEDDEDDDRPKKKRRMVVDDGPRVKTNDNIPVVMLLAFIGSAVALMAICAGCGWWSFDWLVGGSGGGGGWGGNEFEITTASRTPGFRVIDPPNVSWSAKALQAPNAGGGQYYVVMKCGSQTATEQITPVGKGWTMTSGRGRNELKGSSGKLEVWIEKRSNPVANGTVVSNVYTVP